MPEDASGGWRDERKHSGLSRSEEYEREDEVPVSRDDEGQKLLMDQEMSAEDISRLLADGGPDKQQKDDEPRIESDAWAAYHIAEELKDIREERGEYWVLEISGGQIEPAFVVKEDEIVTNPDYNVDEAQLEVELDGEEYEAHPFGLLQYTGEEDIVLNREYKSEELPVPRIDGEKLQKANMDRMNGSYIAPGLTEDYREAAEEVINRFYSEEM
jgi:hypothetical protein